MSEKKKAAPDGASIENGRKRGEFRTTNISKRNFTTVPPRAQGVIESLLQYGAENAITAPELAKRAGISDTRYLAKLIQDEREMGALILSTPGGKSPGYFLPDAGEKGQREIAAFVGSMSRRASKIFNSIHAARAALEVVEGQQEIEV